MEKLSIGDMKVTHAGPTNNFKLYLTNTKNLKENKMKTTLLIQFRQIKMFINILILIIAISNKILLPQAIDEVFPEKSDKNDFPVMIDLPLIEGMNQSITNQERQVIQALTEKEIEKLNEPEAVGLVRELPNQLSLGFSGFLKVTSGNIHHCSGLLTVAMNSDLIWTTYVKSVGADAIRIFIKDGYLPENCKVYIFNDKGQHHGPYLFNGIVRENGFWTNILFSDYAYIQVKIPSDYADSLELIRLTIPEIAHIEHPSFNESSLGCFEDINCDYAKGFAGIGILSSSTAMISFIESGLSYQCSGTLLNDKRTLDFQPFFLTANHCVSTQAAAQTVVALFDYKTTSCNGQVSTNTYQVLHANLCKSSSQTDVSLLLFEQKLQGNRWYLGWTVASVGTGTTLHSVSYPLGQSQKYSRVHTFNSLINCSGFSKDYYYYSQTIGGASTYGSSGSSIVNANMQVVGQLYGFCGDASNICDFWDYNNIWGRFDKSYEKSTLKWWLDPNEGKTKVYLSVSLSNYEFGNVNVGSSKEFNVNISNNGTLPYALNLEINGASFSGTDANQFSIIGSSSFYIPPGVSKSMVIRFQPTTAGYKTVKLSLKHNASNFSDPFTIALSGTGLNLAPSVTSVTPTSIEAGGQSFTLRVNGNNFVNSSIIKWNGSNRSTNFVSSTQLTASISSTDIATAGIASISVTNPSPGGGTSNSITFNISFVVWPGNTNSDNIVDSRDILPIGRFLEKTGPARPGGSIEWKPQNLFEGWSPPEVSYADCDGNGEVNGEDIKAILNNWHKQVGSTEGPVVNRIALCKDLLMDLDNQQIAAPSIREIRAAIINYMKTNLGMDFNFSVQQNYPNPFNPSTTIRFIIPEDISHVKILVFDIVGQNVWEKTLNDVPAGEHEVVWNGVTTSGRQVSSGMYFYRIDAGINSAIKQMILIK